MPLHESEAIVLRSYPLGEADRLVSFLSRAMGRVRGVAAGARRTKSRFGSTLERLSHIRIWFFEKETRDLVRISQCEMIESFLDAFRRLRIEHRPRAFLAKSPKPFCRSAKPPTRIFACSCFPRRP